MYSCHPILGCYNLFSPVKLTIRSFSFIIGSTKESLLEAEEANL